MYIKHPVLNSVRWERKHKILEEIFGDNALGLTQTYEWFKHFQRGQVPFTMMSNLDGLQQEPWLKIWQKCERLSWKTEGK
jgi:hypothetical protein